MFSHKPFHRILWNAQSDEFSTKIVVYHPLDRFRFIMDGGVCLGNRFAGFANSSCMTVVRCFISGCFWMFYCWWWLFDFRFAFRYNFRRFGWKMLIGNNDPSIRFFDYILPKTSSVGFSTSTMFIRFDAVRTWTLIWTSPSPFTHWSTRFLSGSSCWREWEING